MSCDSEGLEPERARSGMTDYGHELRFGTFITPTSADPDRVVELAVLSDRLGFDLVTFQDHPYQPALLDAWSLLAFVAARTERIHLSANVSNLPLRPPAMLARASVTIDQLSGGRFELGLAPEASGTPSKVSAADGSRAARPSTPSRRRSGSSGRCGRSTSPAGRTSPASTTVSRAHAAGRRARTPSASRSAHTSPGCCGSPAA